MKKRVAVDSELIEEACRVGGHRTGTAAVGEALKEYIRRRGQLRAIDLFGKIDFDPAYDYKAARSRRPPVDFGPRNSE